MATDSAVPPQSSNLSPAPGPSSKPARARIFFILLSSFLVMIAVVALSAGLMIDSWENTLRAQIERALTQKAKMFASEVDSDHTRSISVLTSQEAQLAGNRATVIDMNGKAIADSEVRVADLADEGRRPEFVTALRGSTGVDIRQRSAFGMPVLYVAVPVPGGAVRLAYPLADVSIAAAHAWRLLVLACAIAVLAGIAVSAGAAELVMRSLRYQ